MSDLPLSPGPSANLSELERRLREFESELAAIARERPLNERPSEPPASAPAAAGSGDRAAGPAPPAIAAGLPDRAAVPSLAQRDLELLSGFRDQLERYSRALVSDYARLLEQVRRPPAAVAPAHLTPPSEAASTPPEPAPAPAASGSTAVATAPATDLLFAQVLLEGQVTVEIGPLDDHGVQAAARALAGVPGARSVRVRATIGGRALIECYLEGSVALVAELRSSYARGFRVLDATPRRLSLVLDPS